MPAVAKAGLADAVDAFCESIAFSPEQVARVFETARAFGLPVKLHAEQLTTLGGAALAAEFGALSADHLEHADEAGIQALAQSGTVAVLLPGAFYFLRETQKPPVDLLRKHGVPIAIASDSNPGTSPLTSLLLTMNMAATFFRLTVDECLLGVTREAAKALGLLDQIGTLEAGKSLRPRHLGHRAARRAGLPHRLHAAASAGLEGPMKPGAMSLRDWRDIYRGAVPTLDPGLRAADRALGCCGVSDHRQGRAGLWHQHRLRKARQRPYPAGRPRHAPAQHRAVACRRRRARRCRCRSRG